MSKTIYEFVKTVIRESLSKDIERFELAQDLYSFILQTLHGDVKLARPGDTNMFYVGENRELLVEFVEDVMFRVIMDFNQIPGSLKSQFVGKYVDDQIVKVGTVDIMILPKGNERPEREKNWRGFYTQPQFIKATNQLNTGITVLVNKDDLPKSNDHYDAKISTIFNIFHTQKSTIIHEFAHMFDDISLMGTKKFRNKNTIKMQGPDGSEGKKGYYNSGIEVNARWAEVISSLRNFQYSDYDRNDDYVFTEYILPIAKTEIVFDKLSPPKKRKFILRLWEFFKSGPYPLPEKFIDMEAQALNEIYISYLKNLSNPREYPRSEYSKEDIINHAEWYQYYYDFLKERREFLGDNISMSRLNNLTNSGRLYHINSHYSDENSKKIIDRAKSLSIPHYKEFLLSINAQKN